MASAPTPLSIRTRPTGASDKISPLHVRAATCRHGSATEVIRAPSSIGVQRHPRHESIPSLTSRHRTSDMACSFSLTPAVYELHRRTSHRVSSQEKSRPRLRKITCQGGMFGSPSRADVSTTSIHSAPARTDTARPAVLSAARDCRDQGKVGTVSHAGNYAVASFGPVAQEPKERRGAIQQQKQTLGSKLCALMPFIVIAATITALVYPPSFTWFEKQHYPIALGGIMLSIGVQLSISDFVTVFKQPLAVTIGLFIQYALKPMLGLLTVALFQVPEKFAAGLILTACVSGAQLSSYAANLAKGSVALSVVLTSLSTIASVVVTPALSNLLIGAVIPVDALGMAKSIMQVVIVPVSLGLLLNTYARPLVDKARPYLPILAIACTVSCIGSPLAYNRNMLVSWQGLALILPLLFFHVACATTGYWITQIPGLRQDEATAKTMSITGSMQSSTLAMLLASQFLGGSHPVPPSCSVVIMAVLGLSLGSFWGKGESLREKAAGMLHEWSYGDAHRGVVHDNGHHYQGLQPCTP